MNLVTSPWNIVFGVGFVIYLGIRSVYARRTQREEKVHRQIDLQEKVLMALVIPTSMLFPIVYLFTPLLSFADYELPAFAPWCGAAVMVFALWLFWRSHADLGQNWSVTLEVRKEHQLVTRGVYRLIRHPMYLSIWLWCVAQGLLLENWLAGWSVFVTFSAMYFLRTPREEQMMREFFGDEYRAYSSRTGRLFPQIFGTSKAARR
jgi:protein-S-isoprenylcysteine O-methyltransferase Ste14